jgi:hypothetical protein
MSNNNDVVGIGWCIEDVYELLNSYGCEGTNQFLFEKREGL